MFKRCVCFTLIGTGLLAAGAATGLAWDEEEVSLDQVPAKVRATLLKLAGDAKITEVERETHHGITTYEAEWEVNGLETEVELTASGEVIEIEKEVAAADVPAAVRALAAKKFPAGTKIEYERITMHVYEIEGMVGGKEKELVVSPSGRILHAMQGDDDDDDDDDDGDDHDDDHDDHDDDHDHDHDHDDDD